MKPELLSHWEKNLDWTFDIGRCPFCNSDLFEVEQIDKELFNVRCMENICMAFGPSGRSAQEAVDKWNWAARRLARGPTRKAKP